MPSKGLLILVVEDDVRSARILVKMLREDGFDVELAHDGASAIGRLTREPTPDVVVTDLQMPYADGLAVAKYAQSCRPGLNIFMVTGYPQLVVGRSEHLDPPARVFTKPLDYNELSSELGRVVTNPADGVDGTDKG